MPLGNFYRRVLGINTKVFYYLKDPGPGSISWDGWLVGGQRVLNSLERICRVDKCVHSPAREHVGAVEEESWVVECGQPL